MGIGQKKGFRHTDETKARISATMKPRGRPNGFNQSRPCHVCEIAISVTNHTRHVRACEARAQHAALSGMTLIEIKMLRTNLRQYGLTLDGYFDLLRKQGGGCAICGLPSNTDGRRLFVDHCHETKSVRGLLCGTCNLMIGYAKDNTDILQRAIAYIEQTDTRDYDRDGWDSATPKIKIAAAA